MAGGVTKDWLAYWEKPFYDLQAGFAAIGAPYATPPAQPAPALPLRAYAGTYANDYFGPIEIIERDGGLVLLLGPQKLPFPLRHFDRDVFTQTAIPEQPDVRSGVLFSVGADQTALGVVLEIVNDAGQGAFSRVPSAR